MSPLFPSVLVHVSVKHHLPLLVPPLSHVRLRCLVRRILSLLLSTGASVVFFLLCLALHMACRSTHTAPYLMISIILFK